LEEAKCLDRLVEQWDALNIFFKQEFEIEKKNKRKVKRRLRLSVSTSQSKAQAKSKLTGSKAKTE
jgi:hypothetical protein